MNLAPYRTVHARGSSRHFVLRLLALSSTLAWIAPAFADDAPPPFDRPGIGFASAVLPAGAFDWEQGLPDLERDSGHGVHSTTYTADTLFRFGLTSTLEVQLAGSAWNHLSVSAAGSHMHADGAGDTAIALKWAPALDSKTTTFAMLGSVSFNTGADAFTAGHTVTSLGAAATRDLGDSRSIEVYANVSHGGGASTWTFASNLGFPIHGDVSGYVEVARFAGGGTSSSVAGGGLVWLLHNRVQLDLSLDGGLTHNSPDVLAGFGISVFWN